MESEGEMQYDLGLTVSITDCDSTTVYCSEVVLSAEQNLQQSQRFDNVAIIVGLPRATSLQELQIFLDPFYMDMSGSFMLQESKEFQFITEENGNSILSKYVQVKKFGLIFFRNSASLLTFANLYNNIQLPSYSEVAPCIILIPKNLTVHTNLSSNTSSKSEKSWDDTFSSNLLQELLDCVELSTMQRSYNSTPINFSSTPEKQLKDKSDSPNITIIPKRLELPSCAVCLRRIRDLQFTICGMSGVCDLMPVGRKYSSTGSNYTVDESFINLDHNNESHKVLDCLVCYTYYQFGMRKRYQVSSSVWLENRIEESGSSPFLADPLSPSIKQSDSLSSKENKENNRLGSCFECGLRDNIWLCVICGYTGCGRYSKRHAFHHFLQTSQNEKFVIKDENFHNFTEKDEIRAQDRDKNVLNKPCKSHHLSLELASGRIWNYIADDFRHFEDHQCQQFASYYDQQQQIVMIGDSNDGQISEKNEERNGNNRKLNGKSSSSVDINNTMNEINERSSTSYGVGSTVSLMFDNDSISRLDSVTLQKMELLVMEYENLLETQLKDQQLHYEKLLAKESVQALEFAYGSSGNVDIKLGNTGKKGNSKENNSKIIEAVTKQSHLSDEVHSNENKLEDSIWILKLEISEAEEELRQLLCSVKSCDSDVRFMRKINDELIKKQKSLREKEQQTIKREEEVRKSCSSQIEEMEQQIKDLSFYTRAQRQVEQSPLKDEIQEATVVTRKDPKTSEGDSGNLKGKGKVSGKNSKKSGKK